MWILPSKNYDTRGQDMKLEVLNDINNQCSIVQKKISQSFGALEDKGLDKELQILLTLLEKYLTD